MTAVMLEARALWKSFGDFRAVEGLSLAVSPGELVALIGPNGAGKTTTFNLINGQLRPDRGEVRLAGEDVTGLAPELLCRRGVARTFQISATFASMTAAENVGVALLASQPRGEREEGVPFGVAPASVVRRALAPAMARLADGCERALDEVGLGGQGEKIAGRLAYGDQKRLELAMALAAGPRVLLMDEPTAGMAPAARGELMRLVTGLAKSRALAVLFTEHDMDVVFGFADRVLVMNRGKLIAAGEPSAVRADPLVREVYLGRQAAVS